MICVRTNIPGTIFRACSRCKLCKTFHERDLLLEGTVGNPVEIEQKYRSSLLEKAINVYCIVYYSDKI